MTGKKFGIIHTDIVQDPELSLRAKGLYTILCSYANKNRMCWPKISTLSEVSGVSRRTIDRTLKELEDKNYVRRIAKKFKLE